MDPASVASRVPACQTWAIELLAAEAAGLAARTVTAPPGVLPVMSETVAVGGYASALAFVSSAVVSLPFAWSAVYSVFSPFLAT